MQGFVRKGGPKGYMEIVEGLWCGPTDRLSNLFFGKLPYRRSKS